MTGASATVSRWPKPTDGNRRKHRYRDSPPVSACRDRRSLISLLLSAVHRSCPPAPGISLGRPGWSLRVGGHSGVVVHTALDQDGADGGADGSPKSRVERDAYHDASPVICSADSSPGSSVMSASSLRDRAC